MQEKLDRLRELVQASLKSDPPLFRSVNDLSVKADVDTASLFKFLKARPGESGKTSFVFASKLLYAIGGRVLFPDERDEDIVRLQQAMQGDSAHGRSAGDGYEIAAREYQQLILKLFEQLNSRATPKKTEGPEAPRD